LKHTTVGGLGRKIESRIVGAKDKGRGGKQQKKKEDRGEYSDIQKKPPSSGPRGGWIRGDWGTNILSSTGGKENSELNQFVRVGRE